MPGLCVVNETLRSAWRALQWHRGWAWTCGLEIHLSLSHLGRRKMKCEKQRRMVLAGYFCEPLAVWAVPVSNCLHSIDVQSYARWSGISEPSNLIMIFTAGMVNSSIKCLLLPLFQNVPGGEIQPPPASHQEAQLLLQPQLLDRRLPTEGSRSSVGRFLIRITVLRSSFLIVFFFFCRKWLLKEECDSERI